MPLIKWPKQEKVMFKNQNWKSDPMNSPKAFGELKTNY